MISEEEQNRQLNRARKALLDAHNGLAEEMHDITFVIIATAESLGELIAQLPEHYREPAYMKVGGVIMDQIRLAEKGGRAGTAIMVNEKPGKPN